MIARLQPPPKVLDLEGLFWPDERLTEWAYENFIESGAAFENPDHEHLQQSRIGFLWSSVPNSRGMNAIAGQAEIPTAQGGKWQKARHDQQIESWFGFVPDFLITFYAPYWFEAPDAVVCALTDHELYHCGQQQDAFGAPKFRKSGAPAFGMRGHDVEEFVGVMRRWGVGACAGQSRAFVEAASHAPTIARADFSLSCGTCLKV